MGEQKTPVDRAIGAFGSVESLANAIGQSVHRVYRWRREASKGGRDGRIPDDAQPLILRAARDRGIPLVAEDLIDMREPPEPEPAPPPAAGPPPPHVRSREDVQ